MPRRIFIILHGLLLLLAAATAIAAGPAVRIGVLAYRGPDEAVSSWDELPARLAAAIPGYRFELRPLDGVALREALRVGELEFVLTNSSQYVALAADFGIQRIATVMLPEALSPEQALGSTLLTLAGRDDLEQLADLRGKRIATVAADAFGGYLVAARELLHAGVDLEAGDARPLFVGFPMRRAVEAVRSGEADAAIVRTCLLEQFSAKGLLRPEEFKVIGPRPDFWDSDRIGAGGTPIKTECGWLNFYHGVDGSRVYRLGVLILDLDDPTKVVYRSDEPCLSPEEPYEKEGPVPNVVFSCGAVEKDGQYLVYYGGADRVIAIASIGVDEVLAV